MTRAVIFIAALTLVASACNKDESKTSAKPAEAASAVNPDVPPPADTEATPVAHDTAAKPSPGAPGEQAGDERRPSGGEQAGQAEGKKPEGKKPAEPELGGSEDGGACVADCVRRNQMRAVGPDQIERDCKAECDKTQKCVSDCVQKNQMRAVSAEQIQADCQKTCTP